MKSQSYSELLRRIGDYPDITDDSRAVTAGALFVAGGGREKAVEFARTAFDCGAKDIVGPASLLSNSGLSYIEAPESGQYFGELANAFFRRPSDELKLIAVTGTCGKTTTTYLLESILRVAGYMPGVIGTENYRYSGAVLPSTNTTPGAIELNRLLRKMADAGCAAVIMEVSSHALKQMRVEGLTFDGGIFTNLSTEHQDIHSDMEDYFACKASLFTRHADFARARGKAFWACVNVRDRYGARLANNIRCREADRQDLLEVGEFSGLRADSSGIHGDVMGVAIESALIGGFNLENIAVAVGAGKLLGIGPSEISCGITAMRRVPGRMERVETSKRAIYVDFAHKPGALEAILREARKLTQSRVIVVFGCGGRRDRAKRPEMGRVAAQLADEVIITADNLRGEPLDQIISEILIGIPPNCAARVRVTRDRAEAIRGAIEESTVHDVVIVAGRGSERLLSVADSQGGEVWIEFGDSEYARRVAERI